MARGSRITFYADQEDLSVILDEFFISGNFNYTPTYWDDGDFNPTVDNPLSIKGYGILEDPLASICDSSWLITDASDKIAPKRYLLNNGMARFTVDNRTNPSSVRICLGGDAGDRTLIASQVDTLGLTERAKEIYKVFSKIIRKHGKKIGICYVLPSALSKFEYGWRLTYGKGYASSQDLKHPI